MLNLKFVFLERKPNEKKVEVLKKKSEFLKKVGLACLNGRSP